MDETMVDETMLDGNAVAGLLQDVFVAEMTTATVVCAACGAASPMATTHVYRGAGFVLRCPSCSHAMVTLVQGDGRLVMGFPGIRMLRIPVDGS